MQQDTERQALVRSAGSHQYGDGVSTGQRWENEYHPQLYVSHAPFAQCSSSYRIPVFPEMRAQLRTYHSIPSLQAQQDPNSYKQLQDAPRLKSILKGATEEYEQPNTLDDLKTSKTPRTNPVNLIFIMAQYAPRVSELHFTPPRDFFDLVVRSALSSKSRANAFLWLMWWYLESDYSHQAAQSNPFGPGEVVVGDEPIEPMSAKLPPFEYLTEEQAALENVDTEEERVFGEQKRKERMGK